MWRSHVLVVWEILYGKTLNGNGMCRIPDENGVPGVEVNIYTCDGNVGNDPAVGSGTLVGSDTTDANGEYLICGLPAGDYYVVFGDEPAGYQYTDKDQGGDDTNDSDGNADGGTVCFYLPPGDTIPDYDQGLEPLANLGNRVWEDDDEDGFQDAGEPGVNGVTVYLYKCGDIPGVDAPQETDVTANGGFYSFLDLDPDMDYFVVFDVNTLPAGFELTQQDASGNDVLDSDADPTTGATICIDLDPGETDNTWDAGISKIPASLGDRVWDDEDEDGEQDAGEPGVDGITVYLYKCGDVVGVDATGK